MYNALAKDCTMRDKVLMLPLELQADKYHTLSNSSQKFPENFDSIRFLLSSNLGVLWPNPCSGTRSWTDNCSLCSLRKPMDIVRLRKFPVGKIVVPAMSQKDLLNSSSYWNR